MHLIPTMAARGRASERARRRDERGAALLVSLFVILAMTGLGLVALQGSAIGLRSAGYNATTAAATSAADMGASMALMMLDTPGFATVVATQLRQAAGPGEPARRLVWRAHEDSLPSAFRFDERERFAVNALFGRSAGQQLERSFELSFRREWPPIPVAGSEVGAYCRERIRVDGRGFAWQPIRERAGVGGGDDDDDDDDDGAVVAPDAPPGDSNERSFVLYALTPPVPCDEL